MKKLSMIILWIKNLTKLTQIVFKKIIKNQRNKSKFRFSNNIGYCNLKDC